ncbi:MAG: DNA-3-methyladenine glycosylase I [Lysobacterales bacterium]
MNHQLSQRCTWAGTDPLNVNYHDQEWGVPVHDDRRLFEMLTLEGAQAGLSWLTILRKREGYRSAFAHFDPQRVAGFDHRRIAQLMGNPGIVRHRGKIESTINNARRILALWESGQTLDETVWQFVGGVTVRNSWRTLSELPASTPASQAMSKALKKIGFRFVGETTSYAFMQATGMVNDHLLSCPRYADCKAHANPKARRKPSISPGKR